MMNPFDPKLLEAVKNGKAVLLDIGNDEERRRLAGLTAEIVDLLGKKTTGPAEAYAVLVFAKRFLEHRYTIKGMTTIPVVADDLPSK